MLTGIILLLKKIVVMHHRYTNIFKKIVFFLLFLVIGFCFFASLGSLSIVGLLFSGPALYFLYKYSYVFGPWKDYDK